MKARCDKCLRWCVLNLLCFRSVMKKSKKKPSRRSKTSRSAAEHGANAQVSIEAQPPALAPQADTRNSQNVPSNQETPADQSTAVGQAVSGLQLPVNEVQPPFQTSQQDGAGNGQNASSNLQEDQPPVDLSNGGQEVAPQANTNPQANNQEPHEVQQSFCYFTVVVANKVSTDTIWVQRRPDLSFDDLRLAIVEDVELPFESFRFALNPNGTSLVTRKQELNGKRCPVLRPDFGIVNEGDGSAQSPYRVYIQEE